VFNEASQVLQWTFLRMHTQSLCLFKCIPFRMRMRGHLRVEFAPTWGAASQRELLVLWDIKRWSRGPKFARWGGFGDLGRRGYISIL